MSATAAMEELPALPREAGEPVFREPWEAEAFALALQLHEAGLFSWREWAETLSEEIRTAQAAGDPDLGDTYYRHWLRALERLCRDKGLVSAEQQQERAAAWRRAYLATPHGQSVTLDAAGEVD